MKVRAIVRDSSFVTKGKVYEVISDTDDCYAVRGDHGHITTLFKWKFEIVREKQETHNLTGQELLDKHNNLRENVGLTWRALNDKHSNHLNPNGWLEAIEAYNKAVQELKEFLESDYSRG